MKKLITLTIPLILLGLVAFPSNTVADNHSAYAEADDHGLIEAGRLENREKMIEEMEVKREALREEMEDRMKEARDKMASSTRDRDHASTTRDDIKNRLDEKRDEVREELRQKLADRFKDRLARYARLIIQRFEAAVERLEKLAARIGSRLEKLAERDVDTTEATALLEIANTQIGVAKVAVSNLPGELEALSDDGLTKEDFDTAKRLIRAVKDEIKAAHAALVDVIRNIKAGLNKDRDGNNSDPDSSSADTDSDSDDTNNN